MIKEDCYRIVYDDDTSAVVNEDIWYCEENGYNFDCSKCDLYKIKCSRCEGCGEVPAITDDCDTKRCPECGGTGFYRSKNYE